MMMMMMMMKKTGMAQIQHKFSNVTCKMIENNKIEINRKGIIVTTRFHLIKSRNLTLHSENSSENHQ